MINLAATDSLQGNAQTNSTVTVTVSGMELAAAVETYKILYQGQPTTSVAALYTVAALTTAFIRSIHVVNTAASTQTFALYRGGAAGTNRITPDISLVANGFAIYSNDAWKTYNAQGNLLTTVPLGTATPIVVDTTAGAAGTAALASASDHRHQLSVATNAVVLGTAAAAGAASTTFRSNDTIAAFDATTPTASAVGDAAATGSIAFASRRDHLHGREAFGTPGSSAVADAAAAGVATTGTRSDHKHGREAFATPGATTPAAVSAAGVAATVPRSDHAHQSPGGVAALTATPGTFAVEAVVDKFQIPANFSTAGTTFHVMAWGTLSATAAGQIVGKIRLGTLGTTSDTQVCTTTVIGAAVAAVGWWFEGYMTVRSTGSGGTALGNAGMTLASTAANLSQQTATVAMNTTVANFIDITVTPSGTAPVCTVVNTLIEVAKT